MTPDVAQQPRLGAAARRWIVLAAAVVGVALTARLGLWQLDRAAQKTALQGALDERRALPPLPMKALAQDASAAAEQHHRQTELRGRWLAEATVYLDNRQMQTRPGFFALTPLRLDDGTAVLVQRGWLPRDPLDRTRVAASPLPGEPVKVTGRIAPAPGRLYDFAPGETGPIRQNLDVDAFAAEIGQPLRPWTLLQTAPAVLLSAAERGDLPAEEEGPTAQLVPIGERGSRAEARARADADGLLRDWPAPAADVHKHYGYAFQWFSLAALILGLYVWFQLLRPRRPAPGA